MYNCWGFHRFRFDVSACAVLWWGNAVVLLAASASRYISGVTIDAANGGRFMI